MGGRALRPAPRDFASLAPTFSVTEAMRRWHCHVRTIHIWEAETGVLCRPSPRALKPVPDDFHLVAGMTRRQAKEHYGVADKVLSRWLYSSGMKLKDGRAEKKPRPVKTRPQLEGPPHGLREAAPRQTLRELSVSFGVGTEKMKRWLGELGVSHRASPAGRWGGLTPALAPQVDDSLAGRAAQFLRRHYTQVYDRGKVIGRQHAGTFQLGNRVVTVHELVAEARKKGFEPDAWKMVA